MLVQPGGNCRNDHELLTFLHSNDLAFDLTGYLYIMLNVIFTAGNCKCVLTLPSCLTRTPHLHTHTHNLLPSLSSYQAFSPRHLLLAVLTWGRAW